MSNKNHTVMIALLGMVFAVMAIFSTLLLSGVMKFTVAGLLVGFTIVCAVVTGIRISAERR